MDPIESLMNEHRLIEGVLDVAEDYAGRLPRQKEEDRPRLDDLITFFSQFADACHHDKEEKILFDVMVKNGFSSEGGPIAVMLQEHDFGRARVQAIRQLLAQKTPWTAEDRQWVVKNISAYAEFLRQHIIKEDSILYPMAQAHLPEEAIREIGERFEKVEAMDAGRHERLVRLAESLGARPAAAHPARHT